MRFPKPSSHAYQIAEKLHCMDGATKVQCAEALPQFTLARVRQSIDYMLNVGMLDEVRGVYTVKPYLARWFDLNDPTKQEAPQIVPPRQINVYASPALSAKYLISPLGMREGSNDYRTWGSKHA